MQTDADQIKQAAFAAVSETFEAMIFTQISPSDPSVPSFPTPEHKEIDTEAQISDSLETESFQPTFYQTGINLIKPNFAAFSMTFPTDLAIDITKNLYGWMEEENPPEHLIQDCLAEIINTVAGKLMSMLLDTRSTFALSMPDLKIVKQISLGKGEIYSYHTIDNFKFFLTIEGDLLPGE